MLMQTLSSMVCSCIESKKSTLEGISSAADQTNSESTLKQSKRWLDSKWSDWESFFALYIVGVLNKAMPQGEIILVIIIVALAFVLTICFGFILKKQPKNVLKTFVRVDRVPKMSPILLSHKCLDKALGFALTLFSNLSKNWSLFFT